MEEAIELLQSKDTKERMAGVERLQTLLEQSRRSLSATEVASLVDASLGLLKDNNFRVCQGALQALASAAALASEHLKLHFNALLPAIVERLGDSKQPVRDAGRRLLLALMEISSPTIIVERSGTYAWVHKNWRVREEFARTVASAINLFAATELPFQRLLLPSVLLLLEDSNSSAREAAMVCLEEMYRQGGSQLRDELQRHSLRPTQLKEINARFEKIEPRMRSFDGITTQFAMAEVKPSSNLPAGSNRRSPKAKPAGMDINSIGGDHEISEKPVEPIRVYSEKELTKELEKVAGMLNAEQDWSVRMAAMQRVEGLVSGGAAEYSCFPSLLKQLMGPLSVQLSDRRSSIVKQACHLLSLLSKELLADFEPCAEQFIPVLFKLVVITVLVIAESADGCIKTMLRNCRVARVLPRIVDSAKNDRNSVLRARCCEYALLVLEQWSDSPEIQRSVDLYEDLIKCCVGDAMSEVRSTARMCYRVFAKCWPDRARRLFSGFDPVIQRLINEEEGGIHKRYASPSLRDRGTHQLRHSSSLPITTGVQSAAAGGQLPTYGTSAIVAMDRTSSILSGLSSSTTGTLLLAQRKATEQVSERSLESVLQASQQQVNAIETMLKGMDILDKGNLSTALQSNGKDQAGGSYRKIHASSLAVRVGVDPPSARDPPHPASAPVSGQPVPRTSISGLTPSYFRGVPGGVTVNSGIGSTILPVNVSSDVGKTVLQSGSNREASSSLLASYSAKRVPMNSERSSQGSLNDDPSEIKVSKRVPKFDAQVDRSGADISLKDKDSPYSSIPGFQRPLLRTSARSSASSRSSMEENQLPFGEAYNYMDGLMSLNDALTEGLSVNADWSARVSAFNYLKKLLQQGPRGIQEVTQSFEKVMKLFSEHLDDPHHKVAQAALSTLAELVPACRKSFEAFLERILPHVFSRLVDPKELIRQLGTSTLEIVGNTYSIDSLLPALLRSLDEQRSPKAKMAVIEFAIAAFAKLALNGEAAGGSNLLKLWLAKLAPLSNEKNAKLKETAVTGIISVYSHFDSATVLNFILGLSIEEQSTLRRALKQYTPRIEVDLMNFLQNRSQRTRSKSMYDQPDAPAISTEDGYVPSTGVTNSSTLKSQFLGSYSSNSLNSDSGRKWSTGQADIQYGSRLIGQTAAEEKHKIYYQNYDAAGVDTSSGFQKTHDHRNNVNASVNASPEKARSLLEPGLSMEGRTDSGNAVSPPIEAHLYAKSEQGSLSITEGRHLAEPFSDSEGKLEKVGQTKSSKKSPPRDTGRSIPILINQLCIGNDERATNKKQEALQEFILLSRANDSTIWSQYLNQILTGLLEVLDDLDSTVRELALSTILEMLSNQKQVLEDSVEILLEKLLHSTSDLVAKVSSAADQCLTTVLTQYDPYRCLTVVVPLLVSEDEKTLVTCISCLTKLVGRLPPEELMAQLPSFLPALFDAFGNQSADVRKTVVFCLVDIYIVLGKAFLPYLGSLSSTQLRLVTIYAKRISQARSGTPLDLGP